MTSRERILCALRGHKPDKVPFLDIIDEKMKKMIMERDVFTEIELAEKMQFDALTFRGFYPPLFTAEVKGGIRNIHPQDGLIRKRDDLKLAKFPVLDEKYLESGKKFIDDYGKTDYALYYRTRLGCAGVLNSMGIDGFSYALFDDPGLVESLFDLYIEWAIELLAKTQTLGFDFVWFSDDIAFKTAPMISPDTFREVFLPRMRKVIESVKLPWVYHSDGNLMPIIDDLLSLGMNGLNPIEPGAMDINEMKEKYGNKICLIGNIDLHYTLTMGTPLEVEEEVKERIDTVGKDGGYIISSANSLTDYCKLENIFAMRDAIVKYRDYN